MTRLDESTLSLHLEVALAGASPNILGKLADSDRIRRMVAIGEIARLLANRLRCFDISYPETRARLEPQPTLFPDDLGADHADEPAIPYVCSADKHLKFVPE